MSFVRSSLISTATLLSPLLVMAHSPVDLSSNVIELPELSIVDHIDSTASGSSRLHIHEQRRAPASDGSDLLRAISGVSASRFGGHGLEPVIRGQSQGRLNVLLEGAYIHGGCPNRMDPPTAFAVLESYDQVTVLKGVQTLRYGGGGSGGTVLFERESEAPSDGVDALIGLAGADNGTRYEGFADVTVGNERGYLRLFGQQRDFDNYEDGNGEEVRSSFEERAGNLILGWTPSAAQRLELGYEITDVQDALFPGAGMDAPKDESESLRFSYELTDSAGLDQLTLELYHTDVEHVMNNYALRQRTAPRAMEVPAESVTQGGRLLLEWSSGSDWRWSAGIDLQENNRDATRFWGAMNTNDDSLIGINSIMWPDVTITQGGLFVEGERSIGERSALRFGVRYDRVEADAGRANDQPAAPPPPLLSPNALYQKYYGREAESVKENNWGALLRFEHDLESELTLFTGISRSVRSADASERFLGANGTPNNPAMAWVGNPAIDPEIHHQLDVGLSRDGELAWSGVLFYDDVNDYILRDRAHGQEGILPSDGATIYRNVDAKLYGVELELSWALTPSLHMSADAAYVYAQNRTDGRAIAQTPPWNGRVTLEYEQEQWSAGGRLRWAATQKRVDSDPSSGSGLDARETPGYGVVDLFADYQLERNWRFRFGVDNLLDHDYSEHLNRANQDPFNPDPIQVNEPGRVIWAQIRGEL